MSQHFFELINFPGCHIRFNSIIFTGEKKFSGKVKGVSIIFPKIIKNTIELLINNKIFKDSFKRLRPCYNESIIDSLRLVKENCGGKYGFFSAHASNSFSLAIFFGLLFINRISYIIMITIVYASLISYSRIYLGVHYPIDIIFGSFFGIFVGFVMYSFVYLKFLKFFDKA